MRHFHSYGPVKPKIHYSLKRKELVQQCLNRLIGDSMEGGHYFTIWAPRQTGKTWLIEQVEKEIAQKKDDAFSLCRFSLGTLREMPFDPADNELPKLFRGLLRRYLPGKPEVRDWEDFNYLFSREEGIWMTKGQPGLVSWFGELLTETYNQKPDQPVSMREWRKVWTKARFREPNNNLLNLISKASEQPYLNFLGQLFVKSDIPFSFLSPVHNFLYHHGILESDFRETEKEEDIEICRFSSPFIQKCLFDALGRELEEFQHFQISPIETMDDLADVLDGPRLNLPALITRYRGYLERLRKNGINPWKQQPRKADLNIREAVGHFHLYAWLQQVIGKECVISPEFPTGNGQVDLHIRFEGKEGIIEIKSFTNKRMLKKAKEQSAKYANDLKLDEVSLVVFSPFSVDEEFHQLSGDEKIQGVKVCLEAIGMGEVF